MKLERRVGGERLQPVAAQDLADQEDRYKGERAATRPTGAGVPSPTS